MTTDPVADFLRTVTTPRRRDTPRFAERLRRVGAHSVATPHGAVTAWRLGEAPATMLVHGWEDDSSVWDPMIATLVDRGHALVVFDLPAHGRSEGTSGMGFEATDAIHAVADAVGPIDAIVGHSMGGSAAALAIEEGLSAHCCVLIAPPLGGGNRWRRVAARAGVREAVADQAQAIYAARVGVERVASFDLGHVLAHLDARVLLVQSEDDERAPSHRSSEVVAQLPRLQVLLTRGHGHREIAGAIEVITEVADFLGARP